MKRCCVALVLGLLVAGLLHGSLQAADEKASPPATKQDLSDAKDEAARSGEIAWMLTSSALVMLMVPGLALFYGGMVRKKNVLATMMQSMVALAVVGVYWIAIGYNLAFGQTVHGLFGWSPEKLFFLQGVKVDEMLPNSNIPIYAHVMFQGMFAIITPALISGAVAERIRFGPYCAFLIAWVTLVYCPLAHMVWAMDWWQVVDPLGKKLGESPVGILGQLGALDFAGGTVVHIAAGFSGLAGILVLRKRIGYPEHVIHPNSMVLTLFGAGLLWFGWFGFNGGSALGSNTLAVSAFSATQAAAAAAGLSWMAAEWLHRGKPTALGLASGIVAGLVAVTPASGYVYVWGGMSIGLLSGFVCYISAVCLKPVLKYDDSLDAFGVHGVGGFLGAVLTGVFWFSEVNKSPIPETNGLLAGGGVAQVLIQLKAAVIAASLSFIVSLILVKLVDLTLGFVTDDYSEMLGLDRTEHGETGFDLGPELEMAAERGPAEPRAAAKPPGGQKRYTIVIDGPSPDALGKAWSGACEVTEGPPSAALKAIYPNITFVQANRFRFRGGDPDVMKAHLLDLLKSRLSGGSIRVRVES